MPLVAFVVAARIALLGAVRMVRVISRVKFAIAVVTIGLKGWHEFRQAIKKDFREGSREFKEVNENWAEEYRRFLHTRYIKFSRGGGNWKKTKRPKKNSLILRETDTILRALTPVFQGLPGQFERHVDNGIEVGIGGPGKHPSSLMTVGELALLHQEGVGDLPVRTIVVRPPPSFERKMADDLEDGVKDVADRTDTY